MRTRIFRTLSTALSLLLLVAIPTQAGPIKFVDIINVMGDLQRGGQVQQLELRSELRDPGAQRVAGASPTMPSTAAGFKGETSAAGTLAAFGTQEVASLNAGTAVAPQQPQGDVQVFDQDSIDGTICDCGEIPPVGGGFKWWPFLALIPLVCLTGVCSHDNPPPPVTTGTPPVPGLFCVNCEASPTPTPPPVPGLFCVNCAASPTPPPVPSPFCVNCEAVPEPTSLILFGSGIVALTAGARRRLYKRRANKQAESTTEE
jgi:hypothetical protein